MFKTIQIYGAYFAQFFKARLAYRFDFFMSIVANMLVTASGLVFVYFLMNGKTVPSLKGWSKDEVLFIYGYSMISMSLFSALAPNLYSFGDRYIIQGQFDRVLLRPLNSLCQVLVQSKIKTVDLIPHCTPQEYSPEVGHKDYFEKKYNFTPDKLEGCIRTYITAP